ncbi:hypothetical protein OPW33_04740 [Vibrio europaeus]|uniref:hypothetical protein n=1 Tax=Vibrio europaeus TaxID=300876 RepID=UPI0018A71B8C|nr:hypothetical protein [Vibrio europaeus]MDC5811491.1 hypothetical protein [Vibrio europaeus]MDC5838629.1 hypothetical protein [Vibrio europaeus]QPG34574.1 hypothetical protein IXK98_02300 [Vibrio europaeus]
MKNVIKLLFLISASAVAFASQEVPSNSLGVIVADQMTQGQLVWLKGRVGTAIYRFSDPDGRNCTMELPVAIGSVSDSGLGISETKGFTLYVVSEKLNQAILLGQRINSKKWRFSLNASESSIDGFISGGIGADEGFILNSKRRWISWLMGEETKLECS